MLFFAQILKNFTSGIMKVIFHQFFNNLLLNLVPPPMRKCGTINKYFGNHCLLCEYFTIKLLMLTLVKTNKSILYN